MHQSSRSINHRLSTSSFVFNNIIFPVKQRQRLPDNSMENLCRSASRHSIVFSFPPAQILITYRCALLSQARLDLPIANCLLLIPIMFIPNSRDDRSGPRFETSGICDFDEVSLSGLPTIFCLTLPCIVQTFKTS